MKEEIKDLKVSSELPKLERPQKSRDYAKQYEWEKERYKRLSVCLLSEENEKLQAHLELRGIGFTEFVKEKIKELD